MKASPQNNDYCAQVLGLALVIGVANVECKKFADKNLKYRLACRRRAVQAIWR